MQGCRNSFSIGFEVHRLKGRRQALGHSVQEAWTTGSRACLRLGRLNMLGQDIIESCSMLSRTACEAWPLRIGHARIGTVLAAFG